jgi:pilus assembly protein CpaC
MKKWLTKNDSWKLTVLLALIVGLIISGPCLAAGPERVRVTQTEAQKIAVEVGKSVIIESATPVKRVSLVSPEIADAMVLTQRQIYITGKTPGLTNLTLWDVNKRVFAVIDLEVRPDVTLLKESIYKTLPQEKDIRVTANHNSITLSGSVSSTANLAQVLALAQSYAPRDKEGKSGVINFLEVAGVHQVMLEVRVAEISRSLMKKLGVNFTYLSDGGNTFGVSALNNLSTAAVPGAGIPAVSDSVNAIFRFLGGGATWTVFIDALKEEGLTKVLAEPTLITLSGKPAYFLAGGEYPIPVPQSGTGSGTTITIEYKTFGVGLNFTPTVLGSGKINMEVKPEVSELDFTNAVSLQGYIIPSLTTRRVSTVIELADGQSFAVAGLLKDDVREIVRKFPVLGDLPVIGALFRSTSFQKNETELIVIVTPHIVKPVDMAKQTLPTDQYIEPNDFEFYLLGRLEGSGEPVQSRGSASQSAPAKRGGGLEGEFGHITPK